jgi:hypothetical protein
MWNEGQTKVFFQGISVGFVIFLGSRVALRDGPVESERS